MKSTTCNITHTHLCKHLYIKSKITVHEIFFICNYRKGEECRLTLSVAQRGEMLW